MSAKIQKTDPTPCQIYLITPPQIDDLKAFCDILDQLLSAAPVACLQIRLKNMNGASEPDSVIVQAVQAIKPICHDHDTLCILNDRPDLALKTRADGVHIGQQDMDYLSSRNLLGGDAIIGVTCHDSKELAFQAAMAGADYVAFGAFFETDTKRAKSRANLEILTWWQEAIEIPCVAIGGINLNNAKLVIEAGADFIALSSGIWKHPHPAKALSQLSALCQSASRPG